MDLSARCTVCPYTEDNPTAWVEMLVHEALTGHVMRLVPVHEEPAAPRRRNHLRLVPAPE